MADGKERVEYKYLVPFEKSVDLASLWDEVLTKDPYYEKMAAPYPVSSVYYDTLGYDYYHEKIEGEYFHRKARLRTYGREPFQGPSYFEIKYKFHDDGYKKRIPLHSENASMDLLTLGWGVQYGDREVAEILGSTPIYPVCHVLYGRRAYYLYTRTGEMLRINIDEKIHLLSEEGGEDPVFPHGEAVVEVKCPHRGWWPELAEVLKMVAYPRCTFSKYISALNVFYSHYLQETPHEF